MSSWLNILETVVLNYYLYVLARRIKGWYFLIVATQQKRLTGIIQIWLACYRLYVSVLMDVLFRLKIVVSHWLLCLMYPFNILCIVSKWITFKENWLSLKVCKLHIAHLLKRTFYCTLQLTWTMWDFPPTELPWSSGPCRKSYVVSKLR